MDAATIKIAACDFLKPFSSNYSFPDSSRELLE